MDEPPPSAWHVRRAWRRAAGVLGLILLAAAVLMLVRQHDTITAAWNSIRHLPAPTLLGRLSLLAGTVIVNLILTGLVFSVLASRYGKVGLLEMQAVLAATMLVNYLPLRPGLLGRVAYHKTANGIDVTDSVKMILQAAGWSVAIAAYLLLSLIASLRLGMDLRTLILAPLPLLAIGGPLSAANQRRLLIAGFIRYIEVLVLAVRYHTAFALIGSPIDARGSIGFACASLMASMVPLVSNGLGLREWSIGLLSPVLTAHRLALGVTADLLNRAVEILIALPLGLAGIAYLAHLRRAG